MVKSTLLIFSLLTCCIGLDSTRKIDEQTHPTWITAPTLAPGAQGTATLGVDNAGTTDTVVDMASSDPSQVTVPPTVTVPAGQTQVDFPVTATPTASSGSTVSGAANSEEASTPVSIGS